MLARNLNHHSSPMTKHRLITMAQASATLMKKLVFLAPIMAGFLAVSLQAGEAVAYKQVAPPPPPELYGLGFYGAIDMGANVHQDRGGTKVFSNEFGDTLEVDPKNDVGFFGGIKLGYVFLTGVFRP